MARASEGVGARHAVPLPTRRALLRGVALGAVSVALAACAPAFPTATPPPPRPGDPQSKPALSGVQESPVAGSSPAPALRAGPIASPGLAPATAQQLVVALGEEPATLDPHLASGRAFEALWLNLFDGLLARDAHNALQPGLAESWQRNDELTWEFRLRQNARFSNGEAVTPEAVVFSLQRAIAAPPNNLARVRFEPLAKVEARAASVLLTTRVSDPLLLARLASPQGAILPPSHVQRVGDAAFAGAPIGSGPFRVAGWDRSSTTGRMTLEANREHFRGPPLLDRVVVRFLRSDVDRVEALKAGDVEVADEQAPVRSPEIEASGRADLHRVPTPKTYLIVLDSRRKPLSDAPNRRALSYSVDIPKLIRTLYGDRATQLATMVGRHALDFDPTVPAYPYDLGRARVAMAEGAFPQGFELELSWPTGGQNELASLGQAVAEDLRRAGLNVKPVPLDLPVFIARRDAGGLPSAFVETYDAWPASASAAMRWLMQGRGSLTYRNPDLLALLDRADGFADSYARSKLYGDAQRILKDEAACIPLFQLDIMIGVSRSVVFESRLDGALALRTISIRPRI